MTQTTAEMDLKPCPWCKHTPRIIPDNWEGETDIYCAFNKCPVQPKVKANDVPSAVAKWNTREQPTPSPATPDALGEIAKRHQIEVDFWAAAKLGHVSNLIMLCSYGPQASDDRATLLTHSAAQAARVEELEKCVRLAVYMLDKYNRGLDSRMVSDEFVALACVENGDFSAKVLAVIHKALEAISSPKDTKPSEVDDDDIEDARDRDLDDAEEMIQALMDRDRE